MPIDDESYPPSKCCGCNMAIAQEPIPVCASCETRYPPSLIKAAIDSFHYACKLSDGTIIEFSEATIHGEYCTLEGFYEGEKRHKYT